MTPEELRAWQKKLGLTYDTGAQVLGVNRSTYATWISGKTTIDLRTALACAALANGLKPWPECRELTIDVTAKEIQP